MDKKQLKTSYTQKDKNNLLEGNYLTPDKILESYNPLTKEKLEKSKTWNHSWGRDTWAKEAWGREWGKDWGKDAWRRSI